MYEGGHDINQFDNAQRKKKKRSIFGFRVCEVKRSRSQLGGDTKNVFETGHANSDWQYAGSKVEKDTFLEDNKKETANVGFGDGSVWLVATFTSWHRSVDEKQLLQHMIMHW